MGRIMGGSQNPWEGWRAGWSVFEMRTKDTGPQPGVRQNCGTGARQRLALLLESEANGAMTTAASLNHGLVAVTPGIQTVESGSPGHSQQKRFFAGICGWCGLLTQSPRQCTGWADPGPHASVLCIWGWDVVGVFNFWGDSWANFH